MDLYREDGFDAAEDTPEEVSSPSPHSPPSPPQAAGAKHPRIRPEDLSPPPALPSVSLKVALLQ